MALGSLLGAGAGLGVSALSGGTIPAQLAMGAGAGLGQMVEGGIKKSNAPDVAAMDPLQQQMLNRVQRQRKSIQAGTDPVTQMNINEARDVGSATRSAIGRNTGGDVGGTVSAMLRSQRATGDNINKGIASGQTALPFFSNLETQIANKMSDRKMQIGLLNRSQAMAEAAQLKQAGFSNFAAGLMQGMPVGNQGGNQGGSGLLDFMLKGQSSQGPDMSGMESSGVIQDVGFEEVVEPTGLEVNPGATRVTSQAYSQY